MSTGYSKASNEDKQTCFLQTLLKGCFSLLGVKSPKCALKVSACNIQLFFHIFEQVIKKYKTQTHTDEEKERAWVQECSADIDFTKVFNYLFETMRGLLIYAKEGEFDKLFVEENLIPQLAKVITKCYCEESALIVKLTSQVVNKKLIANDDKVYDMINYTIGTIKCFTQTSKEV